MNIFQLSSSGFLMVYVVMGVVLILGLRTWLQREESLDTPSALKMSDPYFIAYLRAGRNEALRVATVSLLDRSLLVQSGETLRTANSKVVRLVQRPIEKAILKFYEKSAEGHRIFKDASAIAACDEYATALQNEKMLADRETFIRRFLPTAIVLATMLWLTWMRVGMAFSAGRRNVGFLVVVTVVLVGITLYFWFRRRTAQGDAMVADLQKLFLRLKTRAKALRPGGESNEVALLAGVFGLSALPAKNFPFLARLYPAKSNDGSGCGSSSSCSSGSSSCGGGGGGCGGGCGS